VSLVTRDTTDHFRDEKYELHYKNWKASEPHKVDNADDNDQTNARYDGSLYCSQRVVYNAAVQRDAETRYYSSQIYHYRQTQRSVLSDIKYAVILCMFVSMCSVIDISAEVPPIGVKFARR